MLVQGNHVTGVNITGVTRQELYVLVCAVNQLLHHLESEGNGVFVESVAQTLGVSVEKVYELAEEWCIVLPDEELQG